MEVGFVSLRPEKVGDFKAWMATLQRRREEVFETFRAEGTRHELVAIIENTDPPVVVYAMEAEDLARAQEVFTHSQLSIDVEHKTVLNLSLIHI